MDDLNLMEFNSPTPSVKTMDSEAINTNISPGNNPFDSLTQHTNDLSVSNQDNVFIKQLPPECIEDFFNINIQNSGKESLAILKDLDISLGKESLGILKLEALNASFNADNSNVPNIWLSTTEDQSVNYSNNPLNTAFLYSVNNRKPSVLSNNSCCTNPSFNSASLEASEPSNILSCSGSKTFDVFSKSEDLLNEAFLTAAMSKLTVNDNGLNVEGLVNKRTCSVVEKGNKLDIPKESGLTRGCWSVPEFDVKHESSLEKQSDHEDVEEESDDELFNNSVFIEANFLASKIADGSILDEDFSVEDLLDSTDPPDFKILDEFEDDNVEIKTDIQTVFKVIDKMLPPQKVPSLKPESNETDSLLDNNKENVDRSQKDCNNSNRGYESKDSYKSLAYSKNESYSQKSTTSQGNSSNGSLKSRNANELLQNLSVIINNDGRDLKQKLEGQQLLCDLASILCSDSSKVSSTKLEHSEDSGHSSIEQEEHQNEQELPICYQVLDLTTTASKSNDNEQALDLSMKSKDIQNCNKRSSQSFSFPSSRQSSAKLPANIKTGPSIKSSTSLDSKRDHSTNNEFNKLKPKRVEQKTNGTRKGPLKAVIPLGNMAKCKSLANKTQSMDSTPPKIQKSSTLFKTKKTSTPIAEPPIKPMAQSTPDNKFQPELDTKPISCSSQLRKRKFYCPISPLVRPPSLGNMSTDSELNKTNHSNHSGSAPNLSNVSDNSKKNANRNSLIPSPKPIYRRHSATELKVPNSDNYSKLKRSYSIGKEMRPPRSSLSSSSTKGSASNLLKKQSVLQEKNSGVVSKIRSSFLGKGRKSTTNNKENIR
ncbi:hypothetical protein ILUMI_00730 [Ignelater luminosus]|uniref:Uncharacterized protein n=1 Tax=Ignelater luminosus TaxID=2038154 RepID=A0A8K0GMV0_IGNLU|nr:hypothetical protein ILUMI_00730 [Ignelater luminosus]